MRCYRTVSQRLLAFARVLSMPLSAFAFKHIDHAP